MNEEELKDIWKSENVNNLPNIDFKKVQKEFLNLEMKLKRIVRFEIISSIIISIGIIPICYFLPKFIYFTPAYFLLNLWYFNKIWQIYKLQANDNTFQNIKESLEKKVLLLTNFVWWSRIILYSSIPFVVLASLLVQITFAQLLENIVRVGLLIVFFELCSIIYCEIYFRFVYFPSINKSKELIKELESNE